MARFDYKIMRSESADASPYLQVILWLQKRVFMQLRAAFQRLKRRHLREQLRKTHKNNFQSVNTTSDHSSPNDHSNYQTIADFKPITQNYTSVKILQDQNYTRNDFKTERAQLNPSQLFDAETFLEEWMVRRRVPQPAPELFPWSDYAGRSIITYNQEALAAVKKFTFSQYCKAALRKKDWIWSEAEMRPMRFRKTVISTSLTLLPAKESQIAVDAFEILLKAGGELESSHNWLYETARLVELAHSIDDSLKQQVFLQVIKQISSSKPIYMKILSCMCYSVKVSTKFYIPLLNYLYEQAVLFQSQPQQLLNFCFFHTIKNFDQPSSVPPSIFQLYCAAHALKVPVIVSFPKEKVFFIEAYTTIEQFLRELVEYYNLDPHIDYLLEVNGLLMEKGSLLDRYNAYSEHQQQDFRWKNYQQMRGLKAIIVLKNMGDANSSPRCYNLLYNYHSQQYLKGMYDLRSADTISIAALKMHSEMDDDECYHFQYANLISRRRMRGLDEGRKQQYRKEILKEYYRICGISRAEARRRILDILAKSKAFKTLFFKSHVCVQDFQAVEAWVGIQRDRFLVVQVGTGRVMRSIRFSEVSEWGQNGEEVCLKVDKLGKFHVFSRQAEVVVSVFLGYMDYYAALLLCL